MEKLDVARIGFVLIPMIFALTVHEFAHAAVARWLKDDTATMMGRFTLNPLSHIDPIGTLLIPIVGMLSGVPFFGWARPVPYNPLRFTRKIQMKTGVLLTAAAGPLSNLLFAFVLAVLLGLLAPAVMPEVLGGSRSLAVALVRLAGYTLMINVGLFVFNLIPIPPLDGSKVLAGFLPDRFYPALNFIGRFSFVFFILLLTMGAGFLSPAVAGIIRGLSHLVGFNLWLVLYGT